MDQNYSQDNGFPLALQTLMGDARYRDDQRRRCPIAFKRIEDGNQDHSSQMPGANFYKLEIIKKHAYPYAFSAASLAFFSFFKRFLSLRASSSSPPSASFFSFLRFFSARSTTSPPAPSTVTGTLAFPSAASDLRLRFFSFFSFSFCGEPDGSPAVSGAGGFETVTAATAADGC